MIQQVIHHLWQSTLLGTGAGGLALALRKNRARTRYWVWFAAVVKFCVPFGVLVSLGGQLSVPKWAPKAPPAIVEPAISFVMGDVAQPAMAAVVARPQRANDYLPAVLVALWICGVVTIAFCWGRRWTRIHADVRAGARVPMGIGIPVVSSAALREPGVFGIFRPVLLLPEGMAEQLSRDEWNAVLAHELCHVRCYDNLTAAIYMLVETVFWFHPGVWWIGTRLVAERERACDEEVLRLGNAPGVYAEGILKVCERYLESPLECVAGVTGSNLRRRIRAIMTHRGTARMSVGKKLLLAAAGIVAVTLPIVVGGLHAQPAAAPRFDVASIKPCEITGPIQDRNGHSSPGRLNLGCDVLADNNTFLGLIERAYVEYADGHDRDFLDRAMVTITGGPNWVHTQGYKIEAVAGGNPSVDVMSGPMLQRLLEDRFKLKIHRETKEAPVYALTLGKDTSKLKPFQEGSCVSPPDTPFPWPALPPGQRYCEQLISLIKPAVNADGATLQVFARLLNLVVDRPVIDETGVSGKFDIHLTFSRDQTKFPQSLATPSGSVRAPASDPSDPSIFTAVQEQLGLKLVSTKRPVEILVIDSVEKPSEN